MDTADWVVNGVVLLGVGYLSFVMALAGWFAGLRRGEAVTLLPKQGGRSGWGAQLALVIAGLAISVVLLVWL